ncbi:helix-turn-helix transcriptional regulator [Halorubraceae archaeon YAN]|nr:helix-turn-helix transcriptional regulator [Halorubraceae archaeon YAN]
MSQHDRIAKPPKEASSDAEHPSLPEARTEAELLPAEVFGILGNDTRVAILRALLELGADEKPVRFTDLFNNVEMEDSANFSYHLRQLTGHFIKHGSAGYSFRYPGRKVVSAIFTGTLTERTQLGFFPASGYCYACDGNLHGWYVDDTLTIGCTECSTVQVSYPFPSGGLDDRSTDDLLQAFHHYVRHHYCLAADGVCPECTGAVESSLIHRPESDALDVAVEHLCQRCNYRLESAVGVTLLDHAGVLVFFANNGVDLNTAPFWHFDWCVSDRYTELVSADPVQVKLTLPCNGESIQVLVDADVSVVTVSTPSPIADSQ